MAVITTINQSAETAYNGGQTAVGLPSKEDEALMVAAHSFLEIAKKTEQKYQKQLADKDRELAELKRKCAEQAKRLAEYEKLQPSRFQSAHSAPPPSRKYKYDRTLLTTNAPLIHTDVIIDCLIELTTKMRANDKYLLNAKTDWYIVFRALRYYKLFIGDEDEFLSQILPDVLKNMEDQGRAKNLSASKWNLNSIVPSSPMRVYSVDLWERMARKEKEEMIAEKQEGKRKSNAQTVLNRCVNIELELRDILMSHGVQPMNCEGKKAS